MIPKILHIGVAPASDRRRVRLQADVVDFEETAPYMELSILDPDGQEVAGMLVMGVLEETTAVTLHVRPPAPAEETRPYRARGRLFTGGEDQEEQTLSILETIFHFPAA